MFTVFGRGATTNEAYQDAKAAAAFYTEGDKRAWITEGESYRLFVDDDRDKPVLCELTLTRVFGVGEDD